MVDASLPQMPGVYRFRDARDRVLYVGRATRLRSRVASYWGDLGDRSHLTPMVAAIARVEAVVCASVHEAAWLERNLLERRLPRWNRTAGGQENAVYVALTEAAVTLTHTRPLRGAYGPYLGGGRVRTALTGLNRVLPLAYTDPTTGTTRALASRLGVTGSDRAVLADKLSRVLQRDPTAVASVRAALMSRRDQAAESLAFELAGRIQAEIEAVEWLTSPQRVTTLDTRSAAIHGWSAGILTSFTVTNGRLTDWTTTRCRESTAAGRVAATPSEWREFAAQNAVLAAELSEFVPSSVHT